MTEHEDTSHDAVSADHADAAHDAGPAADLLVVRSRAELAAALVRAPRPLGLVPTMGWLHAGHRSLIARARAECASVAVSIFVNPRQFGHPADLDQYPRNEARDLAICAEEGADLVWAPAVEDVYFPGFDTTVSVDAVARPLEGAARPGHFDGVTTVVAVLLGVVRPDRAYFGMKDAQQLRVVTRMAADLALTTVVPCPTVREPDGLAMSSRNVHLAPPSAPPPRSCTGRWPPDGPAGRPASATRRSSGLPSARSSRRSRWRAWSMSRWPTTPRSPSSGG